MNHIRPGVRERWMKIPEDRRDLVMKALTRKEQAYVLKHIRMQDREIPMRDIGEMVAEDQHVFDFPGVGKLIATKECGDFLRIDFIPDLVTPECPETRLWPAEPSLLATVALHHMTEAMRIEEKDEEDHDTGPVVIVQDGLYEDPAAYAYIPYPGRCDVHADLLGHVLTVTDSRPKRVNSAGKIEDD